jgi:hypothetical protein
MVNQRLLWYAVEARASNIVLPRNQVLTLALRCPGFGQSVASNHHLGSDFRFRQGILLTVQGRGRSLRAGAQGKFAMIETVTAVMGLVSAGIFLAHALEGFRSRA